MCPDLATVRDAPLGAADGTVARFSREWWADWTMPIPETGCHVWMGFVHRVAYELAYGPFDPALKVCHRCDVPSCCNPDHLFLGTQADNLRDMFAKGRGRPRGRSKGWRDAA